MSLEWNYNKFKRCENFIKKYEKIENISEFLEENIVFFEQLSKKEIQDKIINFPLEQQLLLLFLKTQNLNENLDFFSKRYLQFCEKYHLNFKNHIYEQSIWNRKLKFILGSKKSILEKLLLNRDLICKN